MSEVREKLPFAHTAKKLAGSLVILPTDSPEESKRKRDEGVLVMVSSASDIHIIASRYHAELLYNRKIRTEFLNEQTRFRDLLVLVAFDHPVLKAAKIKDEAIRASFFINAEHLISCCKTTIASYELKYPVGKEKEIAGFEDAQFANKKYISLRKFQNKILERISKTHNHEQM